MKKSELIDPIASGADLSKVDAKKALDVTIESIKGCLQGEDSIQLTGFGTFSITKRGERKGRNPKTGDELTIKAKNVVKFKAGKELSEAVN